MYNVLYKTISDEDLQLKQTETVLESAVKIMEFAKIDATLFSLFADQIHHALETRVKLGLRAKNIKKQMVVTFKEIITSPTYKLFWQKLTSEANCMNAPILNYYVCNQMFRNIMEQLQKKRLTVHHRHQHWMQQLHVSLPTRKEQLFT